MFKRLNSVCWLIPDSNFFRLHPLVFGVTVEAVGNGAGQKRKGGES